MKKEIYKDYLFILIFSILFSAGLVHEGLPIGHDLIYEITRIAEYSDSLKGGGFPVRWSANLEGGFGEPIFNFFPPLFLITSTIQILLGFSITTVIKGSIFFFTLAGGVGMYLFAREFYERNAALFCACVNIIAPYHLADVYVRNAYSEYTACSLAPFVFWAITIVCKENKFSSRSVFILTLFSTLFVLSHNLSLLMYAPLFAASFLLNFAVNRNWSSLLSLSVAGSVVFLLTAFYILPVLFEREFIQTWWLTIGQFDVFRNFATMGSLFGMSNWYSLTPFSLILIFIAVSVMVFKKEKINRALYVNLCLFLGFLVILLFLITSSSRFIWEAFPSMRLFQFPWRLLSPITFVICFLAGSIIYLIESYLKLFPKKEKETNYKFVLSVMILALLIVGPIFVFFFKGDFNKYIIMPDSQFTPENIRKENLRATVLYEYRPIWVREKSESLFGKGLVCSYPGSKIKVLKSSTTMRKYTVYLHKKSLMTANIHYFPGWKIYNNGIPVHFKTTKQGLIEFTLPAGTHHLKVIFEDTPVRKVGNLLSVLGLFAYGALVFKARN